MTGLSRQAPSKPAMVMLVMQCSIPLEGIERGTLLARVTVIIFEPQGQGVDWPMALVVSMGAITSKIGPPTIVNSTGASQ
eukprot:971083-Rhodomonas_salina.3